VVHGRSAAAAVLHELSYSPRTTYLLVHAGSASGTGYGAALREHLARAEAPIVYGPVERMGGRRGGITPSVSVYIRDPDHNLVEFMCYDAAVPTSANAG